MNFSRLRASTFFKSTKPRARADGMGLPAKGLTGHGYEGQYFWDTESMPPFN